MPRTSTLALASSSDRPTMPTDRYFTAANLLVEDLLAGTRITRPALRDCMASVFGTSDADGGWSMRQAYDVLEAAQLLCLRNPRSAFARATTPGDALSALLDLAVLLPTETYRSEKQIALQQFSTPMPLAWLVARAARITSADTVLEPSAGTGLLAAHAAHAGASLLLNEIDELRAGLLGLCLAQHVTRHDAAHIDAVLRGRPAPDVVLINPPFARSLGRNRDRHAAARHLRSALIALRPGGRCVAIMPASFRADGVHATAWQSVAEIAGPRAILDFGDGAFAAHGTSVAIRLMVFDKGWSGEPVIQAVEDFASALPWVEALPPRLDPPPVRPTPVIPALGRPPGGSWFRASTTALVAPSDAQLSADVVAFDYAPRDDVAPLKAPVGLYVPWRLSRIRLADARPHPDALVESIAMASVPPPVPTYRPMLPRRSAAALSEAQLEAIILAGDAFERDLPGRFTPNAAGDLLAEDAAGAAFRTGFFIGDGTGVGKGREVAACIMDQWCRGRKKAVWVSKSATLIEDARRDWSALGGLPIDIVGLDTFPFGQPISMGSGILFLTYTTLRSQRHDQMSRLDQILAWLGPDHDGMIVFDEAHAMANAAGTETDFGVARGSEQGLAGVRLQNALPRARVLYVSATGATDPSNLCYASRLGLWGPGTSFGDRDAFMEAMTEGGIAAMEIVARDLKAMGLYCARALSFVGVEYDRLEHPLSPEQVTLYDTYADAWALIHRNLDDALKAANIIDRMDGSTLNGQALGSALSRFESSKQRFFSQLLVAMKTPSLIHAIETEVAAGHSAVVQLVTTAEAVLDRRLAELSPEDRASLDLELSHANI